MNTNSSTGLDNHLDNISLKFDKMHINRTAWKFVRWSLFVIAVSIIVLAVVYNFIFQSYEVIGESIQCETNSPIVVNYTCRLENIDNHTQHWSFESEVPDGIVIQHMMVS